MPLVALVRSPRDHPTDRTGAIPLGSARELQKRPRWVPPGSGLAFCGSSGRRNKPRKRQKTRPDPGGSSGPKRKNDASAREDGVQTVLAGDQRRQQHPRPSGPAVRDSAPRRDCVPMRVAVREAISIKHRGNRNGKDRRVPSGHGRPHSPCPCRSGFSPTSTRQNEHATL